MSVPLPDTSYCADPVAGCTSWTTTVGEPVVSSLAGSNSTASKLPAFIYNKWLGARKCASAPFATMTFLSSEPIFCATSVPSSRLPPENAVNSNVLPSGSRSGEKSASSPLSTCSFVTALGGPPPILTRQNSQPKQL